MKNFAGGGRGVDIVPKRSYFLDKFWIKVMMSKD